MTDAQDLILRRVLWSLPTGLYLLGSTADRAAGPWNLMTISQVTQVATEPRTVAFSVEQGSRTAELLRQSGLAALSILQRSDRAVVRRFVKPVEEIDQDDAGRPTSMSGQAVELAENGAPVLSASVGWLELTVSEVVEHTSHMVVLAEVTGGGADDALLSGTASERSVEILRMEDTKMNYGG
jgi:flavin reductase (DIM6/NTAB) family NADH-FMN oxidoreductase RutF